MESWIYVFSEFTSEALFFQALGICALIMAYTAYWILKKRRYGVAAEADAIPVGVVKAYLGELITDAHSLRSQLFGLFNEAGKGRKNFKPAQAGAAAGAAALAAPEVAATIASNPDLQQKLTELEQKLSTQNAAVEALSNEKGRLEQELAEAKTGEGSAGGDAPASGDSEELKKKIAELEERLAEYSVIEDDLANLKRLQQENAQLKEALEGKGGAPEPQAEAASEPTAEAEAPSEPAPAAEEPAANAGAEPTAQATEETPAETPAEPAADSGNPDFEGLVDEVEKSLKPEDMAPAGEGPSAEPAAQEESPTAEAKDDAPAEPATEPTAEPAAAQASDGEEDEEKKEEESEDGSPLDNMGQSDEDLLSEFEKMLNS